MNQSPITTNVYEPPSWSGVSRYPFSLEVIKNGVMCGTLSLEEKPYYILGREQDCDIRLEHESISRHHAILQFREDGEGFIYDLGSTHGSKLNHRPVRTRDYQKLKHGDILQFGQSSRLYIVSIEGLDDNPDEVLPAQGQSVPQRKPEEKGEVLKKIYQKLLRERMQTTRDTGRQTKKTSGGKAKEEDEGISWGMVDEEAIYSYVDEEALPLEPELLKQLPDLTDKQLEKIDDYSKKWTKLKNIENEIETLRQSEVTNYGLSETLRAKKEGMEKKVNELLQQVQLAEENLKFMLFQQTKAPKKVGIRRREEDSFGDDGYLDRTVKMQKTEMVTPNLFPDDLEKKGFTYESTKENLDQSLARREEMNRELLELANTKPSDETMKSEQEEDPLDQFMKANDLGYKEKRKLELIEGLKEISKEITRLGDMLRVLKPKPVQVSKPTPVESVFDVPVNKKVIEKPQKNAEAKETGETSEKPQEDEEDEGFRAPFLRDFDNKKTRSAAMEKLKELAKAKEASIAEGEKKISEANDHLMDVHSYEAEDLNDEDNMDLEEEEEAHLRLRSKVKETENKKEETAGPSVVKVYGPTMKPTPRNMGEIGAQNKNKMNEWVPPADQLGDGSSLLNKKYGY